MMYRKTKLLIILLGMMFVCLFVPLGYSTDAPEMAWEKTFGGSDFDSGMSVQETSDGGYIISGNIYSVSTGTTDVYLVKTDSQGIEEWSRTFGSTDFDSGFSVQETRDGGYIIAGIIWNFDTGATDVYLVKTDSQGVEEWSRTLGDSQNGGGFSVQETRDGGYIVTGHVFPPGADASDVYLVKTDSQGIEEWSSTFGGSGHDSGASVKETSDGGYIISGTTWSFGTSGGDVYLVKVDSQGSEVWSSTFGGSGHDSGASVKETSDGGYIITGLRDGVYIPPMTMRSDETVYGDVYLVKTDSQGVEEWSKAFGGSDDDGGRSVQVTSDGGYIIAGWTYSSGAGESDVYLVKVDSQGMEEWSMTFGGSNYDDGRSVQVTSDGGYIIIGTTWSFGAGGTDVYLVKVGSQGEVDSQDETDSDDNEKEIYTATFVDLEVPDEITAGESYTVNLTLSYEFSRPTEIHPRINIVGTEMWIEADPETLVGSGNKTYSIELTAPHEEITWALEASVWYLSGGELVHDEVDWGELFDVQVTAESADEAIYSTLLTQIDSPKTVIQGESFEVVLHVDYEFSEPTMTRAGIIEQDADDWIALKDEVLEGNGTSRFTFRIDAPLLETTWNLEANVMYQIDEDWVTDNGGWSESLSIDVLEPEQEETYSAWIVDFDAPGEVYVGESFTVELTVSYEFSVPTEIRPGIKEVDTERWIAEESEILVGERIKMYSFELTAPEEESTWALEASVWYLVELEWVHDEEDWAELYDVEVIMEVEEEQGGGIPGYPLEALVIGLLIGFYLMACRAPLDLRSSALK